MGKTTLNEMKHSDHDNHISEAINELNIIKSTWETLEKKQLITWRIRFFIGLIIAAAIYALLPESTWVWWLILGLSAISLTTFAVTHLIIKRKLQKADKKITLLKKLKQQESSTINISTHAK